MGLHAAPKPRLASKAASTAGATLALVLFGGGTAIAASAPAPTTLVDPTGVTPSQSPAALPPPVQQAVDTLTGTVQHVLGAPTPAPSATPSSAPPAGAPQPAPRPTPSTAPTRHHSAAPGVVRLPHTGGVVPAHRAVRTHHAGAAAAASTDSVTTGSGGATLAAGARPGLAPPSPVLPAGDGDGARSLFVALAAAVIGGLTLGHVKVARDRVR